MNNVIHVYSVGFLYWYKSHMVLVTVYTRILKNEVYATSIALKGQV